MSIDVIKCPNCKCTFNALELQESGRGFENYELCPNCNENVLEAEKESGK